MMKLPWQNRAASVVILNTIGGSSILYFKGLKRLPQVKRVTYAVIQQYCTLLSILLVGICHTVVYKRQQY